MTIWKISPGNQGEFWQSCRKKGMIAVGWWEVSDLSRYDTLRQLAAKCKVNNWPTDKWNTADQQLWDFYNIRKGDVIVAYGYGEILGIGIANGKYYYDNSKKGRLPEIDWEAPHRHKVIWIIQKAIDITKDQALYGNPPNSYGSLNKELTIYKIEDEYTFDHIRKIVTNRLFPKNQ